MANEEVLKNETDANEDVVEKQEASVEEVATNDESEKNEAAEQEAETQETAEYDTFTVELSGISREWAITDEFDYEGKHYLICAEVVGDELSEAGLYLFEGKSEGEELEVKNLESEAEYNRVAEAYCKLTEE